MALASCADDAESPYLNGKDKTPIAVSTTLASGATTHTRAVNKKWEKDDKFFAVIETRATTTEYSLGTNFTINETIENASNNITSTDKVAPTIFWDDYSSTTYDLREKNESDQLIRGIRLFYGVSYNGRTTAPTLTESTGKLDWTVEKNQTTAENQKTSDLLYAKTQEVIHYEKDTNGDLPHLTIPFTHAMSKITINLVCGKGFGQEATNKTKNLGSTTVTLHNINTKASVTAPTTKVEVSVPDDIDMLADEISVTDGNMSRSYSAIVAPTVLKEGMNFATVTNVDGNNYYITLTDAIINAMTTGTDPQVKNDAWSTQLAAAGTSVTADATAGYDITNGGITKPGVNYVLTVNVNKQEITVVATIQDWDEVKAETTGKINFAKDVNNITVSDEKKGTFTNSFDIYRKTTEENDTYGNIATTASWDAENSKWTYSPTIYWPQDNMPLYFRALSGADEAKPLDLSTDNDLLWGTTDKHDVEYTASLPNHTYNEGDAIDPRTQDIPLIFYHTMSKVKFILQNDPDALDAEKVDLNGAKIQLTNLYGSATLDLHEGTISYVGHTKPTNLFDDPSTTEVYEQATTTYSEGKASTEEHYLVPQEILDESRIVITLADGTKYSAQLNKCKVTSSESDKHDTEDTISQWYRNVSYIYTITLGKEDIHFRALIKKWDEVNSSGNATLEWD